MTESQEHIATVWWRPDNQYHTGFKHVVGWCFGAAMITSDGDWWFLHAIASDRLAHEGYEGWRVDA